MLIHRTAKIEHNQSNGDLIIQRGKMYKIKDFNDGERAELEQVFGSFQTATITSPNNQKTSFYLMKNAQLRVTGKNDDKGNGGAGKIFGVLGIIGILVIGSGVVVAKKRLNKKIKKV